jgi:hypothetical protein
MVCLNIQPMTHTLSRCLLCQLLLTISMNGKHILYSESHRLNSKVYCLGGSSFQFSSVVQAKLWIASVPVLFYPYRVRFLGLLSYFAKCTYIKAGIITRNLQCVYFFLYVSIQVGEDSKNYK